MRYVDRNIRTGEVYGVIYLITNLINGKMYIGQTVTSLEQRWQWHVYDSHYDAIRLICKAIRKYGRHSFRIALLAEVKSSGNDKRNQVFLDNEEIQFIAKYKTFPPELGIGYNMNPGGSGIGKMCKESRERCSASQRGKVVSEYTKKLISRKNLGRVLSAETRVRQSRARLGKSMSANARKNMSIANAGRPKSKQHKEALSRANTGKFCINNSIFTRSISAGTLIPEGWVKGRHKGISNTQKEHLRKLNTGKKQSEQARAKNSNSNKGREKKYRQNACWITNGIVIKLLQKDNSLPIGYFYGRKKVA